MPLHIHRVEIVEDPQALDIVQLTSIDVDGRELHLYTHRPYGRQWVERNFVGHPEVWLYRRYDPDFKQRLTP